MSYAFAILWYSIWFFAIGGSYFASRFAIRYFDKKWKAVTEEEERALETAEK
jgi:hypothetical protein